MWAILKLELCKGENGTYFATSGAIMDSNDFLIFYKVQKAIFSYLKRNFSKTLRKGILAGRFTRKFRLSQGKSRENCWNFSRIAKSYTFWDLGHRERRTCREPWVDTAGALSPPSVRGVFLNRQFQPSRVLLIFMNGAHGSF